MGQVALGLRSLAIRITVFVVMAALLAWALGGTLWPRPASAVQRPVLEAGGSQWGWLVTVDGAEREVSYRLARRTAGDAWKPVVGGGPFPAVEPLRATSVEGEAGVLFSATVRSDGDHRRTIVVGSDGTIISGAVAASAD